MGCDIHLHVEVKVNGKWEHYSHPRINRNYELFGIMAGVRDEDATPICEPKGLPCDLSLITQIDYSYDKGDAHSESWLNRNEIGQLLKRTGHIGKFNGDFEHSQLGYAHGNSYSTIGMEESGHPKEYEDVRFVFWFDN